MKRILGIGLLALCGLASAQMTYYLVAQWWEGGNQMCKYSNGTVLNVGINLCPLSIK